MVFNRPIPIGVYIHRCVELIIMIDEKTTQFASSISVYLGCSVPRFLGSNINTVLGMLYVVQTTF